MNKTILRELINKIGNLSAWRHLNPPDAIDMFDLGPKICRFPTRAEAIKALTPANLERHLSRKVGKQKMNAKILVLGLALLSVAKQALSYECQNLGAETVMYDPACASGGLG